MTLIVDLLDEHGPDSSAILHAELTRARGTEPWVSALIGHVAGQLTLPAADLVSQDRSRT